MARIRNATVTITSVGAAVAAAATMMLAAAPARADGGGDDVVRGMLVGSTPAPVSPVIAGIRPGGAPWVNGPSPARVGEDGRVDVVIRGLVIPALGRNPIPSVVATLVCGEMAVGSTAPFALSTSGDGQTRDHVTVPQDCDDATVLIQPAANRAVYIAATTPDTEGSDG